MKKLIIGLTLLLSFYTFANEEPLLSETGVIATEITVGAAVVETGLVLTKMQDMIVAGASNNQAVNYGKEAFKKIGILRKISLVGLAYVIGDFTGTRIYENLSQNRQKALGEILHIMVKNTRENLGLNN